MPKKLSQGDIRRMSDEWAELQTRIRKAEDAKAAALAPIVERHNGELKPVLAKFDRNLETLRASADQIESVVTGWLGERTDDTAIAGELAVASRTTETKIGGRVIDARRFLDAAKSKGEAMWECVSVAIAKAEKLLGQTEVDALATKKETTTVLRTLRLK